MPTMSCCKNAKTTLDSLDSAVMKLARAAAGVPAADKDAWADKLLRVRLLCCDAKIAWAEVSRARVLVPRNLDEIEQRFNQLVERVETAVEELLALSPDTQTVS